MEGLSLAPHPAVRMVHGNPVPVITDVQQVMLNGVRVAYCGCEPGRPVNFIRSFPQAFQDAIVKFVAEMVGEVSCANAPPSQDAVRRARATPRRSDERDDDNED